MPKKKFKDLEPLAEGKLTARVYDKGGNLKEEVEKLRVKGKGAITTRKRKGEKKKWQKR